MHALTPRRGTIASRYLDAISCGGNDVSALSMSSYSTSKVLTPDQNARKNNRKILNNSSCGMTAPTAAMNSSSASWTTMETRSRSDGASRAGSRGGPTRNRRVRSTGVAYGKPERGLGVEDDCSSIESASSHQRNRPAHLSVEMEDSFVHTSMEMDAPRTPTSQSSRRQWGESMGSRGIAPTYNKSPNAGWRKNSDIFPRTTPTRSSHGQSSPFSRMQHAGERPSPGRHVISSKQRWQSAGADDDRAVSDAGAPTEIVTNRTQDVLLRAPFPMPSVPPPTVQRRPWPPTATDPSLMQSLIDDTSTNEESTTPSHERPHIRSLLDAHSDSMSTSQATTATRLERHVQSQASPSRLNQYVNHHHQPTGQWGQRPRVLQSDSKSQETGTTGQHSLKTNTGANNLAGSLGGRDFVKGSKFGGRQVGVRRPVATKNNFNSQDKGEATPSSARPQSTAAPTRFYMADEPIQQPLKPQQNSSGEMTSSVSTTDKLLDPGFQRATEKGAPTRFIRYNERKTPNADDVFQRRASSSEFSNSSSLSYSDKEHEQGYPVSKSPIQPLFSLDRLDLSFDAQSPIRKFRSQSQEPHARSEEESPKRSQSFSAQLQREILERQHEREKNIEQIVTGAHQSPKPTEKAHHGKPRNSAPEIVISTSSPDPIFCPGNGSFSSQEIASPPSPTMSQADRSDKEGSNLEGDEKSAGKLGIGEAWSRVRRNSSVSTGLDEELIHIMERSNQQSANVSRQNSKVNNRQTVAASRSNRGTTYTKSGVLTPHNLPTKPVAAMQGHTSAGDNLPKIESGGSVKDRIKAFNSTSSSWAPPKGKPRWKPQPTSFTSRESLVMGAHIARTSNEEKKDDFGIDMSSMQIVTTHYDVDDDDTASVRSLREKFERNEFPKNPVESYLDNDIDDAGSVKSLRERFERFEYFNDPEPPFPDDEDDDTASVKSLREKLEQRLGFGEKAISDDADDDGSVRSLRERFETPKKRESGAKVSNLKAMFETNKKSFPSTQKRAGTPSSTRQNNPAAKSVQTSVALVGMQTNTGVYSPIPTTAQLHRQEPTKKQPIISETLDAGSGSIKGSTQIQDAAARAPSTGSYPAKHEKKSDKVLEDSGYYGDGKSKEATVAWPTNSLQTVQGLGDDIDKSMPFDEDDTHSSHSSRVRGPAPTPFLSMRDRLLSFSKTHNRTEAGARQKKHAPPTMQERLNRWASRHQAAKREPLASQDEHGGSNLIQRKNSYDLSSVKEGISRSPFNVPPPTSIPGSQDVETKTKSATTGFFNKTNQLTRERQNSIQTTQNRSTQRYDVDETTNVPMEIDRDTSTLKLHQSARGSERVLDGPGMNWLGDRSANPHHLKRNDSKGKSAETDYSDGVTLDVSIAEISNLTVPSTIRSKESKEILESEHSPSIIRQSAGSSSHVAELQVPRMVEEKSKQAQNLRNNNSSGTLALSTKSAQENPGTRTWNHVRPAQQNTPASVSLSEPTKPSKGPIDASWDSRQVDQVFPFRTPSSEDLFGNEPKDNRHLSYEVEWPTLDDRDWGEPTPSEVSQWGAKNWQGKPHTKPQTNPDTEPRGVVSGESTAGDEVASRNLREQKRGARSQNAPHFSGRSSRSTKSASPDTSQKETTSPPTVNGVLDASVSKKSPDEAHSTVEQGSDLASASLSNPPSPFDKDYEAIMESRHKMLLSRQRAHQRRRAAIERAQHNVSGNDTTPAHLSSNKSEPPGSRMPNVVSSEMMPSAAEGTQHPRIFGRTHPITAQVPNNGAEQIFNDYGPMEKRNRRMATPRADERADDGAKTINSVNAKSHNMKLVEDEKWRTTRSKVDRVSRPEPGQQSTSFFSRVQESLGFQGASTGMSRHEALVARLKSVKAARLRRAARMRTSRRYSPPSEDEASHTTYSTYEADNTTAIPQEQIPQKNRTVAGEDDENTDMEGSNNQFLSEMLEVD